MRNDSAHRRILALWLRRLPTDRIQRGKPAKKKGLVVVGAAGNALRLTAFDDAAEKLGGLRLGMTLADARAMYPGFGVERGDEKADADLLGGIAAWCERYTPLVGIDAPDGIFLDIAGCAHLFGGEIALLGDLSRRLEDFGCHVRAAIADTAGCAWAMAHYGEGRVVPARAQRAALLNMPLAALRLDGETIALLRQSGLVLVGDMIDLPRAPLAARFGTMLFSHLDGALGLEDEPIAPRRTPALFSVQQSFFEPVTRMEDVLTAIGNLAMRLCPLMEMRGQGARALEAVLFRVDGAAQVIAVGTSAALRDPSRVRLLFADRLYVTEEEYDAGFGYDLIRLDAAKTETFMSEQAVLSGSGRDSTIAHLIDRLGARFGETRVERFLPHDTHIPEVACIAVPARDAGNPPVFACSRESLAALRPPSLFAPPEPIEAMAEVPDGAPVRFRWRRVLHEVGVSEGPERIAMEWWRDEKSRVLTRDYFRVETAKGFRAWVYREGLYGETAHPRWFLHGLFA